MTLKNLSYKLYTPDVNLLKTEVSSVLGIENWRSVLLKISNEKHSEGTGNVMLKIVVLYSHDVFDN